MWELDYKECWSQKNWCFWTVVSEKTLDSPLDCKEIQPVHLKGNLSWMFIVRTDVEVETPILWPPHVKSWLIWKDPDAGKDWRQEEKGIADDEMLGWHHWLNGHEFEQALGDGEGQGSQVSCSPWGHKESNMTERLSIKRVTWMTKLSWNTFLVPSRSQGNAGPSWPKPRCYPGHHALCHVEHLLLWLKAGAKEPALKPGLERRNVRSTSPSRH